MVKVGTNRHIFRESRHNPTLSVNGVTWVNGVIGVNRVNGVIGVNEVNGVNGGKWGN